MKMWIARDECGSLWIHRGRPKLETNGCWVSDDFWQLEERDYPEVTFENSPMEVELVIRSKMEATRYVIQNNRGEFYWKGETSSLYGFDKKFDKAFLFKSKQGAELSAELRMRIFPNCTIKEVELKLIEK